MKNELNNKWLNLDEIEKIERRAEKAYETDSMLEFLDKASFVLTTDVPTLCKEVRRLKEKNKKLRKLIFGKLVDGSKRPRSILELE